MLRSLYDGRKSSYMSGAFRRSCMEKALNCVPSNELRSNLNFVGVLFELLVYIILDLLVAREAPRTIDV